MLRLTHMMDRFDTEASAPSKFQEAMRKLLKHIPEEHLVHFHPTKGVLYLWCVPELHEIFLIVPDKVGKDAKQSAVYRQQGNDLFKKKRFVEALEMFNLSVLFAPFPNEKTANNVNHVSDTPPKEQTEPEKTKVTKEEDENQNDGEITNHTEAKENTTETPPTSSSPEKSAQNGDKRRTNQKRNRKRKPRSQTAKDSESSKSVKDNETSQIQSETPKSGKQRNDTVVNGHDNFSKSEVDGPQQEKKEGHNKTRGDYTMAYVIANRSACLYFLHLYKECISDIDLAFRLGYPDDLTFKLHERKAKCLIQLGRSQEAVESFQKATMSVADAQLDDKGKQDAVFSFGKQIKQIKDGNVKIKSTQPELVLTKEKLPAIAGEKSPKFKCTSTAFKMAVSDTRGRHIVTEKDIAISEVVSCEEPYSSILYPEYHKTHCNRCLCRVIVATPCRECSNVMYCSATCEEKAWGLYHQVECPVLSWLQPTWVGRLGHLALRTVLVAAYTNLKTYFCNDTEIAKLKRMSAFDSDGTYSSGYNSVFHLVGNAELRSPENIFNFSLIAVLLIKIYFTGVASLFQSCGVTSNNFIPKTSNTDAKVETPSGDENQAAMSTPSGGQNENPLKIPPFGPGEKQLEILSLALIHHLQVIQCNGFAIPEMQGKEDFRTYVPRDVGVGLYTVHGLLNHSCDPDLDLCFYGHTMVARALKGVSKGKEICIDYGVLYFTQPTDLRQSTLKQQYYFECDCIACVEDWPLWHEIECVTPRFRCGSCRAALPAVPAGVPLPSHIICLCGHETAILKNLSLLNDSHQRYAIAMKLKGESSNESIMQALIEHLSLMDQFICPPWRDFVSCQSSVKQSFRLMGNWCKVRGDIPPAE